MLPRPSYTALKPQLPMLNGGKARGKRMNLALGNQGKVHLLLASYPMPKIEQVYTLVFEGILNQKLSSIPVVEVGRQ
jgi:hypothetical protein